MNILLTSWFSTYFKWTLVTFFINEKSKRRNGWSSKYAFFNYNTPNFRQSQTLYRKYNILKALKIFEALEKI